MRDGGRSQQPETGCGAVAESPSVAVRPRGPTWQVLQLSLLLPPCGNLQAAATLYVLSLFLTHRACLQVAAFNGDH
jgi:hypothetical protein